MTHLMSQIQSDIVKFIGYTAKTRLHIARAFNARALDDVEFLLRARVLSENNSRLSVNWETWNGVGIDFNREFGVYQWSDLFEDAEGTVRDRPVTIMEEHHPTLDQQMRTNMAKYDENRQKRLRDVEPKPRPKKKNRYDLARRADV